MRDSTMSSPKRKNPRLEEDERAETGITQSHTEKRATLLPFHLFTSKVICNDLLSKTITVSGRFDDSSDLGVLVAEKTPLTHSSLQRLLVSCKVDKKFQNDVYSQYVLDSKEGSAGEVKVRMVYPATEEHVKKYAVQKLRFVLETPEIYQKVTKLYIERKSFSLDWVYNILDGKAEKDRVIYQDPDPEIGFVLLPDFKWDQSELENLHMIAIARRRGIYSVRELRLEHVSMLRNILTRGKIELCNKYGMEACQLRVHLHYQPSYYHLHVHFTHVQFRASKSGVEDGYLLEDVIDNIVNIDPLFYAKKSLSFTVKESTALWIEFSQYVVA